ncbi:hypothetical protein MTBGP_09750 [Moorella thermoacetica]|uniref:hypothetical protein n=1 Tax=Neomoorella thermoacetica TaxID=1525 RepID=UPI0030D24DB2
MINRQNSEELAEKIAAVINKLRFGATRDGADNRKGDKEEVSSQKGDIAEIIAAYANRYRQAKLNRR